MMIAALIVTAGASARTNGPFNSNRHVLPGTKPSWTTAAPQTAAVPAGRLVHARVWLTPRNAAQLDALAQAVSDPSSAQYGQFISADQYDAQYAPTSDQVSEVTQWLTQAGLGIDATGPDNHYVAVSGSASAVATAFGTSLADYLVNGKQAQAPVADLSVPDSLAGLVTAVTGLSTLGHAMKPADFGAPDAFVNATPCSRSYGDQSAKTLPKFQHQTLPYAVCGYTPDQLRGAYGVNGFGSTRNLGRGETVAITDAYDAPSLLADANRYAQRQGDPQFSHGQFQDRSVPEDASTGNDCGGNGWYGEQTLDVEAVHAMAPGANVLYYGAASCFDDDLLAQLAQIVHDNKASIVTNSWGDVTFYIDANGNLVQNVDSTTIAAYESVFKQGAVQGIGFMFSSGDNGDELANTGYAAPDYPTSDPWVTSVGGTSLAVDRRDNRMFETGWGTEKYGLSSDGSSWVQTVPFLYGAGGGISTIFPEPAYQRGIVGSRDGPRRARRRHGRRPDDGHARRRDAELLAAEPLRAGRHPLRRVPDRRDEPRLAAVRRRPGGRPGQRGWTADRLRQPARLLPRARPGRVLRRDAAGRPGQRPGRLRQRPERGRRHPSLRAVVRPGLVADDGPRLGRRDRSGKPHPALLRLAVRPAPLIDDGRAGASRSGPPVRQHLWVAPFSRFGLPAAWITVPFTDATRTVQLAQPVPTNVCETDFPGATDMV